MFFVFARLCCFVLVRPTAVLFSGRSLVVYVVGFAYIL